MKRLLTVVLIITLLTTSTACNNLATKTGIARTVSDYKLLYFYSGGQLVRLYKISSGSIIREEGGAGWYFNCDRKLVRLSGQVIVEPMDFEPKQLATKAIECK